MKIEPEPLLSPATWYFALVIMIVLSLSMLVV